MACQVTGMVKRWGLGGAGGGWGGLAWGVWIASKGIREGLLRKGEWARVKGMAERAAARTHAKM